MPRPPGYRFVDVAAAQTDGRAALAPVSPGVVSCVAGRTYSVTLPGASRVRGPSMTRIIAFFNQKGGTAKTTSTLNVAAALAEQGRSVLAIDLDPQASLTMAIGVDVTQLSVSAYDLLIHEQLNILDVAV